MVREFYHLIWDACLRKDVSEAVRCQDWCIKPWLPLLTYFSLLSWRSVGLSLGKTQCQFWKMQCPVPSRWHASCQEGNHLTSLSPDDLTTWENIMGWAKIGARASSCLWEGLVWWTCVFRASTCVITVCFRPTFPSLMTERAACSVALGALFLCAFPRDDGRLSHPNQEYESHEASFLHSVVLLESAIIFLDVWH